MKNLLLLCALISVVCFSCDGRQTKKEALDHAVSQFNRENTSDNQLLELATYHPEGHVEIVTDTLMLNDIKVYIKNYSLSDEQILIPDATNQSSKKVVYQRVFESEIIISKASKDIFRTHISAKQFKALDADPFWANATLQHAWVNQELSNSENINLDISFINPKTDVYKLYRMSIDTYGQQTLKLIEQG